MDVIFWSLLYGVCGVIIIITGVWQEKERSYGKFNE
jgi:hypothetical protein